MSSTRYFRSSIGRKLAMGLSALFLVIFLLQHLLVNLTALFSADLFNTVSQFYGTNFIIQFIAQPILVFAVVFHFVMGFILEAKNRAARPIKYVKNNGNANSTWMSRNMLYTGLVILIFLGLHLYDFFFPEINLKYIAMEATDPTRYYPHLIHKFSDPIRVIIYILGFIFLALHLLHGFGSMFQSMGQNNKHIDWWKKFGTYYAIGVPAGFVLIALVLFFR